MAIGISISGEPGTISAAIVRDSLSDLLVILADASANSGSGDQQWRIADLRIGSAVMSVTAPDEAPVAALVRDGLESLSRMAEIPAIPAGWTRRMVGKVRDLGSRSGHDGATGVNFIGLAAEPIGLTSAVVDHATRSLGTATLSYGSFRGHVDRWNEHNKREIGIALDDGGTITATYPPDLAERIRAEAVGRHIEVWGLVSRNPAGQANSIAAQGFDALTQAPPIPIANMAGAYVVDGTPMLDLAAWMADRGA